MTVQDEKGNNIDIQVYGKYEDDICIESAYYEDDVLGEVSEDTIDYILENYQEDIYTHWYENKCSDAETYFEGYER